MRNVPLAVSLIALLAVLGACSPHRQSPTPTALPATLPAGMPTLQGKLLNQISRLEKRMPLAGSQGFVIPTDQQKREFSTIIVNLRRGTLEDALSVANRNEYELIWYTDQNDEDAVDYLLREADPSVHGWGLYVLRANTHSSVIIEAPHPVFDQGTPGVAADLFRALNARALIVAGAHRDANRDGSADASANSQTIFQAVHEAELQQSLASTGSAMILQIHGFSAAKHPAYPQVVVSYERGGDNNPLDVVQGQQLAAQIVGALKTAGIKAGQCGAGAWRDLCGSTTVQAVQMNQGVFIHLELDESVREKDERFIKALVSVFIQ